MTFPSEWTPTAYMKIILVDMTLLEDALSDANVSDRVYSKENVLAQKRYAVGEALRYVGKVQDNLKLLHQVLNREAS